MAEGFDPKKQKILVKYPTVSPESEYQKKDREMDKRMQSLGIIFMISMVLFLVTLEIKSCKVEKFVAEYCESSGEEVEHYEQNGIISYQVKCKKVENKSDGSLIIH